MNKRPSLQFYPADWRKDPDLQMCSMSTQGIWINLLCIMWEGKIEGEITGKEEELIRLIGCTPNDFLLFSEEIKRHKFGNVTNCNGNVTIINRRMRKVFLEREGIKSRVRKHRQKQSNENVTNHSSSTSSSSTSKQRKGFVPPTLEDVKKYISENSELNNIDPQDFWKGYSDGGWIDTQGKPVRNWKLKLRTRSNYGKNKAQCGENRGSSDQPFIR